MTIVAQLRAVDAALAANDLRGALGTLLDAWRGARIPRLADLVDHLSSQIELPPIAGKSVAIRIDAWEKLATARDPMDVRRLAAEPPPKKLDHARAMIDAWTAWPDDPRVASALIAFVEGNQVATDAGIALVHRALDRLGELGDVRVLARIRASLATKKTRTMHVHHHDAIAALEKIAPPELEADAEARLEQLERRFRPELASAQDRRDNEGAFLAAIYAAPHERGPIAVYGDWLQAKNDPRGEFIALQLAGKNEPRQKKLVTEFGVKWAGSLGKWFRGEDRRFENGFFAGGKLRDGYADEILADPAWPMIRVLEVGPSLETLVRRLFGSIHALGVITEPFAEDLAAGNPATKLRELHWIARDGVDRTVGPLATFAGIPTIETLAPWSSTEQIVPWCQRAPVIERLARLIISVGGDTRQIVDAVAARRGVREIEFGAGRFGKQTGWNIRAMREGGAGPFTSIVARWSGAKSELAQFASTLQQTLAAVPERGVTSVTFEIGVKLGLDPASIAIVDAAVDRFATAGAIARPWRV